MGLRDILVILDGSARDKSTLAVAVDLAQRHAAHLSALCPLEILYPDDLAFTLNGYPDQFVRPVLAERLEQQAIQKAAIIEAGFREQLRRNGLEGDWQAAMGPADVLVARRAGTTDLVVIGQADPERPLPKAAGNLVEDVLMTSGRPLLLVPYAGCFIQVGRNAMIGWNGSREASRAVHDALPLLQPAAKVTVLCVQHVSPGAALTELPTAEIAAHLARHGLAVTAARTVADGISDADALLSYACDIGADLLVVGGYGHSRMRELILGGVTRALLQHMTLPVLISH
jgi:nucleotide-binding universal stress UspA family protein